MKKADAAEEWTAALDAAERAVDEGRREVSSIAIAIATASGATRKAAGPAPTTDFNCGATFKSESRNLSANPFLLVGYSMTVIWHKHPWFPGIMRIVDHAKYLT